MDEKGEFRSDARSDPSRGPARDDEADGDDGTDGASASGESKQHLAEERTDWAKERTLLAKQRTFAAWLRTGLSSVAVGFAAAEFLGDLEPRWTVITASVLLVVAGGVIFVIGVIGYRGTFRKLQAEGVHGLSPWIIGGVTLPMLAGASLLLYGVVG
jgi:putative membrane protein